MEDGHIQIIEISGSPVGMIQIFESENEIEIGEIQISPAYQGQGFGSKILTDVISRANNLSKNIALAMGLKNQGALRLYNKLGFQESKRSETHIHMIYVTK